MTDIYALIAEARRVSHNCHPFAVEIVEALGRAINALTAERALSDRMALVLENMMSIGDETPPAASVAIFDEADAALTAHTEARKENEQ